MKSENSESTVLIVDDDPTNLNVLPKGVWIED